MRASRLLSLLMLLQVRGRTSAAALARELEVSVRTIYRDVEALSEAGIPIYAEQGRLGGLALQEGFRTKLTGLTGAETQAVPFLGLLGAAEDLGLGLEAAQAQLKLLASLPPDAGARASQIAARFHVDPVPWYHTAEAPACLPELARALWQDRRIRLDYEPWGARFQREVGPLGLVLKAGTWYLIAQDGRPKTYRVSSIRGLEVLDTPFRRPTRFDLATYWASWLADFEARLSVGHAELRITEEGLRILRAVQPSAAREAEAAASRTGRGDWRQVRISVEAIPTAVRQLLRLGTEVEVLGPPELRAALAEEARRIHARHRR